MEKNNKNKKDMSVDDLVKQLKLVLDIDEEEMAADAAKPEDIPDEPEILEVPEDDIPAEEAEGRILADPCTGCPPAAPILTAGERVTPEAICCFRYYGIKTCRITL